MVRKYNGFLQINTKLIRISTTTQIPMNSYSQNPHCHLTFHQKYMINVPTRKTFSCTKKLSVLFVTLTKEALQTIKTINVKTRTYKVNLPVIVQHAELRFSRFTTQQYSA